MGQYMDMAAGNASLKEYYDGITVENLAYEKNPFLAMVPKDTDAEGKVIAQPILYENSQGRSSNFANAQGNQTPAQMAEFFLTLRSDYSIATLQRQLMLASQSSKGGFIKWASKFIDIAIRSAALSAASSLYRGGTGSIGQIATGGIAAGVITLSNPADVSQFAVNMTLQASSTDGGAPRATLGYVIARNVVAGTITVSNTALGGAAGSPTGWTAADFLLVQGDSNSKMSGLTGWLPSVAPTATDNWFGTNRSPDSRLYGLYYNGSGQSIEEAVIDQAMLVSREGGDPRHLFLNYGSASGLLKAMGTRREYVDWTSEKGSIGFRGFLVQGPNGPIETFSDRNCQGQTGFLLQLDTWTLYSLMAVPHMFHYGDDGSDMLRVANADAAETRTGYYGQLGTNAPGWNSQITFSS